MPRRLAILTLSLAVAGGLAGCERREGAQKPATGKPAAAVVAAGGAAPSSFAPIVKQVSPAVVSIDTLTVGGAPSQFTEGPPEGLLPGMGAVPVRRGAGSGFIISPDGFVVTNNHVVEGAREIVVSLADGRQLPARLVGRDPPTDLAVLKVEGRDLPHVSFAQAATPQVGDWVVAVGNPYGLGGTATAGIVSAHGREIGEGYVSFLQIDAPINSGNSGGPSFDLQGRVVGVNTAILSPSGGSVGIGFAIPAEVAQSVTDQLIKSGRVMRGYVGVGVQDLTPALAIRMGARGQRGAVVVEVASGGPAAGRLRPGDIVTGVGGQPIASAGDLMRRVANTQPNVDLALDVMREGRRVPVTVRVDRRPDQQG
ncbi:trypsin-like peptidase domain-containing protein [Phenylobacterium sp. LjRoot219]|uniref:S1C family serine protease n=1 Tax=Phenylobacterium sp. LjRoot219 TaxID=3342283 RepID=UPI003ECDBB3F